VKPPPRTEAVQPKAARSALAQSPDASQIRAEQTQILMEGLGASIPASLAVAGVMSYVQWSMIDHGIIVAWFSAAVLVNLVRAGLGLGYFKTRKRSGDHSKWLHAFIAGTAVSGAVWGVGAWLLYPPEDVAHQAFQGVLVAGLTAGAVTSLSASLSAALAFLLLALTPLAARFLSSDQDVIFALGLLTILFLIVTAVGARRMNANIVQNVRLRLQSNAQVKALRESEEQARKLSMVAARTDNAVILTDGDGRIEWVNDGFTRLTGFALSEVIGRKPGSILQGPETDLDVVKRMREKLRRGEGFEEQILNFTKDKRPYWVSIEVQPIRDDAGRPVQFMAIERDITESREHERQLEQARQQAEAASQAKSTFLAMMSHEVRTPLNGVLGSLGLLRDTVLDGEQRKYLETSRRSAEWLLTIINNILDFSKMEAGKIEIEPTVFSIPGLVGSIVGMLEQQASKKAIQIHAEIDPCVPGVAEGDATKIGQALLNLASNGVKFTSRGEVAIGVSVLERAGNRVRLRFTVSDTGSGIPSEQKDTIFDEFWSRRGNESHGAEGTGLGLSISRKLVHALGGDIDFESSEGSGSRFWFDIPINAVAPDMSALESGMPGSSHAEATWPGKMFRKGRVLVAEDNPANQMIIQSLLERLGLTVDVVANGLEALDAASSRSYDLVMMDIGMPEMDGIAATRAIRALESPMARVPIVAVTAHVMRGERESLLTQGLDDYLSKPIDRTALLDCVTRWIKQEDSEVTISDRVETLNEESGSEHVLDRGILDQLFEDVGAENAEAVVDAFLQELEAQTIALQRAADSSDVNALAQASHRLKSSAASFGAIRLSRVVASIEQAARAGQTSAALAFMREFQDLAKASHEAMDALRRTAFRSTV
jgi:PAS domain S-box-containing protein